MVKKLQLSVTTLMMVLFLAPQDNIGVDALELSVETSRHRVDDDWKQWDVLPMCDKDSVGLQWNKPYNCVECMERRKETKDLDAFYQWMPCRD